MKLCCCCRFLTAGLLCLTMAYIGMILLLKLYVDRDCMDEECHSEGVDNSIITWSSDFFVAFFCLVFAFHLSIVQTAVRKSAILAQVFMGGAFIMSGIGHWMYPNSGLDDNQGLLGYWVVWIGSNIFFTISGLGMAHFALRVTKNVNPVRFNPCWATSSLDRPGTCFPNVYIVAFCELLLVLALSVFLTGGVWCSVSSELQVTTIWDEFAPTTTEINACYSLLKYADFALHVTYALLWLPVGFLLRAAALQWQQTILGLPTHIAGGTAVLLQWSVGSMFPVYLMIAVWIRGEEGESYSELWQRIYGSVIYHWAMLLTLYCLHNLAYRLPEGELEDRPSPWSIEWMLWKIGFGPENDPQNKRRAETAIVPPEEPRKTRTKSLSSEVEDSEEEEVDRKDEEFAL